MFEIPTYEEVLQRCLDRIPNTIDKRQGSIIYDAIAPAAVEIVQLYIELFGVSQLVFIDTSTGEYLDRLVEQNGVKRKGATKAIRKGVFSKEVPIGSRFAIDEVTFVVLSKIEGEFTYRLQCEQFGSIGNEPFGTLTPISNIQGLTFATLEDIIQSGDDVESDEALVERFRESVLAPSFGGNVSDYQVKTKELEGVGGVKVIPIWDGPGTVKLIITTSNHLAPTDTSLVNQVQQQIDPQGDQLGMGIAPIGHKVTVEAAQSVTINIKTKLLVQPGITPQSLKEPINEVLGDYFNYLNSTWDSTDNIIVRTSQVEAGLLGIIGVIDVESLEFDLGSGGLVASNIVLETNEVISHGAEPDIEVVT